MFANIHFSHRLLRIAAGGIGCLCLAAVSTARAATPSVEQALKLTPMQKDVDYDRPADAARCTIQAEKKTPKGQTGWIVRDADGKILREFVDTNGDNVVDRWSYFKDGVEVYRDVDPKFAGKATEHRWLNTAGIRWGVSRGDGQIDAWRMISPEEVSAEVVMALRDRDSARFARLLLTPNELKSLSLSPAKSKELSDKLDAATGAFADLARRQNAITSSTNWIHFSGNRPGIVPAGTFGLAGDIEVYENAIALAQADGHDVQIQIGTLIKIGECWRLIDAPTLSDGGKMADSAPGFFFLNPNVRNPTAQDIAGAATNDRLTKMMEQLQQLDDAIVKAPTAAEQGRLNDQRADYFEQLIGQLTDPQRTQLIHQMADTISAAVQSGSYPKGAERLKAVARKLDQNAADADLAAYVEFRGLQAEYSLALQAPNPEFAKVQAAWLQNLEQFVGRHPNCPDAADAMLQLGIAEEFAGQEDKAKKWYGQIAQNFAGTPTAKKAAGAVRRLDSVGKQIELTGQSTKGEQIDLGNYRGKLVLIQYWATWCEPAKVDMAELKELQAKYSGNLAIIGVSLDANRQTLDQYLAKNPLPWPQLFEPGGLDSRYANELGVLTLPTMILLDDSGKVLNRGIHITELDTELKNRVK